MDSRLADRDWLEAAYRTRSLADIAAELGCSRGTVRNRCVALGITRRPRGAHFKGKTKPPEQRAKMSATRRAYWAARGGMPAESRRKISVTKRRTSSGTKQGYPTAYDPEGRTEFAHRLVAGVPYRQVVHHRDEDITNYTPENLQVMTNSAHRRLHAAAQPRGGDGRFRRR
jgi:hypothetical protein